MLYPGLPEREGKQKGMKGLVCIRYPYKIRKKKSLKRQDQHHNRKPLLLQPCAVAHHYKYPV